MPAMATLTINNYAATPVNYQVLGIKNGVASWADTSQGTVAGYRMVDLEVRRPQDPTKQVSRVIFNLSRPFVNVTTGLVDYIGRVKIEVLEPPLMGVAERQEMYAAAKNFIAHTFASDATIKQENMY